MLRAALAIQKIIQVTKPTAMIESDAADQLLGLEGEALGPEGQGGTEGEGDDHGDADAEPDRGQQVAAVGLDQVGDEDADDERGFETLAQARSGSWRTSILDPSRR